MSRQEEQAGKPRSELSWPYLLLVAAIVLAATAIRGHRLAEVPAGLYCDEAQYGYNAYTIAHFGTDEWAQRFPLFFRFQASYKDPGYIYSAVVPVSLLGLSELSTRLTSAFYGAATVAAIFWLAWELWGIWAGVTAAAILAATPWHIHFSRISFSLIGFPFTFVVGLYFALRALNERRRSHWMLSGLFFGLTVYFYAVALLFVPLFLGALTLLYAKDLWRERRRVAWGLAVLVLVFGRVVLFKLTDDRDPGYFQKNTWLNDPKPLEEKAEIFVRNYSKYFSAEFLFESGDHLMRHQAKGFGELLPSLWPLYAGGLIMLFLPVRRKNLLIVAWILLYPLGACLMDENPSASRSFIGSPIAALLSAHAVSRIVWASRGLRFAALQGAFLVTAAALILSSIAKDLRPYLESYFGEYARVSARGLDGFQYGYREMIAEIDRRAAGYSRVLQTSNQVNMPYIFQDFYLRLNPFEQKKRGYHLPYPEMLPEDLIQEGFSEPVLYALREEELSLFADYDVLHEIVAPDGVTEWVIAEVRAPRNFLTEWSVAGPMPAVKGERREKRLTRISRPPIEYDEVASLRGFTGPLEWAKHTGRIVVNLNDFYRNADPRNPNNPEHSCAVAKTFVLVPVAQDAIFTIFGSDDPFAVWHGKRQIFAPSILPYRSIENAPLSLEAGWNEITVQTCEEEGEWFWRSIISRPDGTDIPDLQQRAVPPDRQ